MVKRLVMAIACVCILTTGGAARAACNSGFYLEVNSRFHTVQQGGLGCQAALKRHASVANMCGKCRSTFNGLLALDSLLRRNQSCFSSAKDKQSLRQFLATKSGNSHVSL